jgi:Ran GTPase-activating protein (RanGAP) involved in mRNA processing and transport
LGESLIYSTVSRLELHNVRFGSSMIVEALAEKIAQHRKWQLVAFDACYLEDNEVAAIARALSSRCCHVQALALPANYCQEEGMIAIAQLLLDSNVALKRLDLSGQDIWDDRRYFVHLERALSSSECCLEHLHLASNFIDDDPFIAMLQSLIHNSCLRALDLRQNRISDRGIEYLSGLIPFLSMDTLDLRNNQYSSRPLGDLSSAMKHQRTMRNLRIDHCRRAPFIAFYTALNRAGRYCQGDSNFPLGLWPFVLEHCQKTNGLPLSFSTVDLIFEMVKSPGLVLR